MVSRDSRAIWMTAGGLFICNLAVGLWFINEGIFHYDSVILAQAVEKTYQTGCLQPAVAGRYGSVILASIIYFPFFLAGQNADFAIRLSSLLSHSLSIVALFFLILELFADRRQAFLGALLLSFVPFYFSPNTYGKEHGMSMLFLILSFYILHRGLRVGSAWQVGWSGLVYAVAVSIRESILVMFPVLLVLYLSPSIQLRPLKMVIPTQRWAAKTLLAWILPLALALGGMFWLYLIRIFSIMVLPFSTATVNFLGFFSPMLRLTFYYLVISVPGLLFFFALVGILRMAQKGQSAQMIFLLCWAASIFYFGNTTSCPVRYMDQFIVPVCVTAACALSWLYNSFKLAISAMVTLIVFGMLIFMYPIIEFRHYYNGTKQFALYVGAVTDENAVIVTADDFPFIEYYGHRKTMFVPLDGKTGMEEFIKKVKRYLDSGVAVYFTEEDYKNQYQYMNVLVNSGLRFDLVGEHMSENYHNPDLLITLRRQTLYKVSRVRAD